MGKSKRLIKFAAIMCAGGTLFACWGGGCLGGGSLKWLGPIALDAAEFAAFEFLLDNDAVFDLFQDDFGTGTQYDDRFVAAPTRAEPDGFAVGNLGAGN